jgi:PWWP domain
LVQPEGPEQAETELFKYKVNDLVWGKVKSHPWWPGQIYDQSLASEAALKIKKESHFLVAYFGDKTFAWIEASALKPYMNTFPKMEKQSRAETFVRAMDSSLAEISRRIEAALTCSCSDKKSINEQLVDNAGIMEGTHVLDVDSSVILKSFKVESIMEYVQEVAVYGSENMNWLELVMARAYLKAFDKFRGFPDPPAFGYGEEFGNDPDKFSELEKSGTGRKRKTNDEQKKDESEATPKKRGRPKKKKLVINADDSDYDTHSDSDEIPKRRGSSKKGKRVKMSGDEYDLSSESDNVPKKRGRPKKMKRVEISNDEYEFLSESDEKPKKKGRPKKMKHVKISDDEYDPMSESDEMPEIRGRGRPKKNLVEISKEKVNPVSKARSPPSNMKSPIKFDSSTPRKRGRPKKTDQQSGTRSPSANSKTKVPTKSDTSSLKKRGRPRKEVVQSPSATAEYLSSTEMLTGLCLTAQNPVKSSSFTSTMQSLFTKYKNSLVPESLKEKDLIEETTSATKSGRKVSKPKHIQDSYWTDVMVDTGSDKDEEPASSSGQKKKRGPYNKREKSYSKPSEVDVVPTEENTLGSTDVIAENSDESEPTGLVLHFNNPDAIPTVQELNEIFGPYGPLREADTETDKKLNRATVIFKRRADAEGAFSSTGKYGKFGPALLSYELNYSPGPPKKIVSGADVVNKGDALTSSGKNLVDNGEASIKDGADLNVSPGNYIILNHFIMIEMLVQYNTYYY